MKVYTSYFGNWRKFPADAMILGITRYPFKGLKFPNEKLLAPGEGLIADFKAGRINDNIFAKRYVEELHARGFTNSQMLAEAIEKASGGKDIVLCCYEKTGEFCHRHVLAELLKNYFEVEEL